MHTQSLSMQAAIEALKKLHPAVQWRSPVMFIVYLGSLFSTVLGLQAAFQGSPQTSFIVAITLWLWFTILFANFAEAYAEGRGKAQSHALKSLKKTTTARKLVANGKNEDDQVMIASDSLRMGDVVRVEQGETIPADGEIIAGVATVDESAITGESAPVIRAAGSDFCSVTGGTLLVSDYLIIRVNANPGESFLDQMITMVESAQRQKTPNEIALTILLVALSLIFILVVGSLYAFSRFSVAHTGAQQPIDYIALVALLVCLIPTTIGGLLSAIGVAGMNRMMKANVMATSGRAVETAGNIDVLLLDKTGTITFGNRMASDFIPAHGIDKTLLLQAAYVCSHHDNTPEGSSIVRLAQELTGTTEINVPDAWRGSMTEIPFSAQSRMSGVDIHTASGMRILRKGSEQAIAQHVTALGRSLADDVTAAVHKVAASGATPLVVSVDAQVLGVVVLKDIVKPGIKERFGQLRQMGIKTVMITGDNPLTAAAIASEAGVDDYLAEATPEQKLTRIRDYQAQGLLVAMTGDGTNDAPALAQADVAVAMNSGTQAAKEASNMVDMDSDPTKLIEVVQTGKQLLMTRGALTTFSIANDIAKYFAIIPALFMPMFPQLALLNVMGLHSPQSALLSAVIFNALIIVVLIPLAMKGVRSRPEATHLTLRRNLLLYGVGGVVVPFVAIKLIDVLISGL
ncbi:potassium-transporting ATPase subunit KdpB [Vitreoscilla massiliensis]|uniref:Potassium-transporting ATPase ATP-binding subunit n=1 Tax=Vitreoscilla massiliensis TaxID=1689272 RepID=A0ABY4E8B1_9NEIS|nr:potassium-transporting ATPase subunit KdpB [Vitreoscilla massiliensis]UOO91140.1 potassium-transporting ATPase subunit KdpB [Vitreoscilla massiliensis]